MNNPLKNSPNVNDSVLLWRMADAEDCGLSLELMSVSSVEDACNRQEFVLQLSQRKHLYAVVVATHPFQEELRLLRQFLASLTGAPPVVLVLTDCPYPMMGVEKDFHAVANLNDSFADLHASFGSTRRHAIQQQLQSGDDLVSNQPIVQRSMLHSGTSLRMRLARAARQPVVEVSGETGTARRLLVRQLHLARGGNEQNCLTFYRGTDAAAVNETISQIVAASEETGTFVLREPDPQQLNKIVAAFERTLKSYHGNNAQLVIVNQDPSPTINERDAADAFIQLAPLRDQLENISDVLAGTMSVYANHVSNLQLAVEPQVLPSFEQYDWPGNICQFNIVFASAIVAALESSSTNESTNRTAHAVVLSADNVARQLEAFPVNDESAERVSRAELRTAYQGVCEKLAETPLSVSTNWRNLLNTCLLSNSGLVWRADLSSSVEAGLSADNADYSIRRAA